MTIHGKSMKLTVEPQLEGERSFPINRIPGVRHTGGQS
jgi:hypothetical protein